MTAMDIHQRDDLAIPQSLPEFQQQFPDDAACAAYLNSPLTKSALDEVGMV